MILLCSKPTSSAGNGFAMQQRRFRHSKSFSCAAAALPGPEIILLFRKTNGSTAPESAAQQRQFLRCNAQFIRVKKCSSFNVQLSSVIFGGAFGAASLTKQCAKRHHRWHMKIEH
jgi:hypothetical protein